MKKPAVTPQEPAAAEDQHLQQALDEALRESFPASDPIAVSITPPVALHEDGGVQKKAGPARPAHGQAVR